MMCYNKVVFFSRLKVGMLIEHKSWGPRAARFSVHWDVEVPLYSSVTDKKGRGMELSDLCLWRGRPVCLSKQS